MGAQVSVTAAYTYTSISPPMRATPTLTFTSLVISDSQSFDAAATLNAVIGTSESIYIESTFSNSGAINRAVNLRASSNSSGKLEMSSEL